MKYIIFVGFFFVVSSCSNNDVKDTEVLEPYILREGDIYWSVEDGKFTRDEINIDPIVSISEDEDLQISSSNNFFIIKIKVNKNSFNYYECPRGYEDNLVWYADDYIFSCNGLRFNFYLRKNDNIILTNYNNDNFYVKIIDKYQFLLNGDNVQIEVLNRDMTPTSILTHVRGYCSVSYVPDSDYKEIQYCYHSVSMFDPRSP